MLKNKVKLIRRPFLQYNKKLVAVCQLVTNKGIFYAMDNLAEKMAIKSFEPGEELLISYEKEKKTWNGKIKTVSIIKKIHEE